MFFFLTETIFLLQVWHHVTVVVLILGFLIKWVVEMWSWLVQINPSNFFECCSLEVDWPVQSKIIWKYASVSLSIHYQHKKLFLHSSKALPKEQNEAWKWNKSQKLHKNHVFIYYDKCACQLFRHHNLLILIRSTL
jgi:hypothetical protein